MKYYKLYFQKAASSQPVVETISAWGMYCMEMSVNTSYTAKDVSKNEWNDEHGDDEYIPEKLMLKGYETTIKLGFKGDKFAANTALKSMLNYLTGADGTGAEMKFYCDYTKEGRCNTRFVKINDNAELVRGDDGDILVISVTLKVNDPVTDITCQIDDAGNVSSLVKA